MKRKPQIKWFVCVEHPHATQCRSRRHAEWAALHLYLAARSSRDVHIVSLRVGEGVDRITVIEGLGRDRTAPWPTSLGSPRMIARAVALPR